MAKPTIRHYGTVINDEVIMYNEDLLKQQFAGYEGKEFYLEVREKPKNVTQDQHGYYRGAIVPTCLEFESFGGWDEKMVHDFFVDEFLSYKKIMTYKGVPKEVKIIPSHSSLNRKEMSEFIDKVLQWLAQEGIYVMTPEQYNFGKYKTE